MAMPQEDAPHRPGDFVLNRYMPNASEAEREAARDRLGRLGALLVRIHARGKQEKPGPEIRANGDLAVDSQ